MCHRARLARAAIAGLILACVLPSPVVAAQRAAAASERAAFDVEDYFRLQRFGDIVLSGDGQWLAYSVTATSLESDAASRQVYLQALSRNAPAAAADALDGAWALAWIPSTHRLAYLSATSGLPQVHSLDVETGEVRQLTRSAEPVISFLFAPDGKRLAYASRAATAAGTSLYDQFRNADSGILIDTDTLSSHDFVNPDWNAMVAPQPAKLWVADAAGSADQVPVPGEPLGYEDDYFWSPSGDALSIAHIASETVAEPLAGDRTSIGIFDLRRKLFRALATAIDGSGDSPGVSYSGGQWLAGGSRILVRRVVERDPWVSGSFPDWTFANVSTAIGARTDWRPIEFYPGGLDFFTTPSGVLVENTVAGEHSLFALSPGGLSPAPAVAGLQGSSGQFSFSADGRTAAFVNQSLTRPPELFLWRSGSPARPLTRLNEPLAREVGFTSRDVSWRGKDGVTVKGWLLEPKNKSAGPLPLVTHVHGGPAFPYPNAFAAYFSYWPYPLEVYPERGIAVFLPNYRGTQSFGRQIATATGDEQAIEDIVSGVRSLVDAGIADPARLGISGHSHGALVGPLAMAQSKMFRASSFAEGVSNQVVMYELMSGDANRYIHDPTIGVSLYRSPRTYVEGSADLQLEGVETASLFEAGARTSAIFMLGLAKAARRFGMPTDFVIYPKTAHNLAIPALQKESAERNLDWFDFWLNGREDPDPSKADQYARWRKSAPRPTP